MKLEELQKEWLKVKKTEDSAKENRIMLEEKILKSIAKDLKDEGSITKTNEKFKMTVTTGYTEKYDQEVLKEVDKICKEELNPVVTKYSIDKRKLKDLSLQHLDLYDTIIDACEAKPKKASFKIIKL